MTETIETADLVIAYERWGPDGGPPRFRDQATMRSGQIGALGCDLRDLIVGLDLRGVLLAGHDWGARASYVACVLVPERISGLVAMSVGYGSASPGRPSTRRPEPGTTRTGTR